MWEPRRLTNYQNTRCHIAGNHDLRTDRHANQNSHKENWQESQPFVPDRTADTQRLMAEDIQNEQRILVV
jgi:hypothetical protein